MELRTVAQNKQNGGASGPPLNTLIHTLLLTYSMASTSTMARTSMSTSTVRRSRTTSVEDDERMEPARKRRACA